MAFRTSMDVPTKEEIALQLLGMAEAFYDGVWAVGWSQYDSHRPNGWPLAWTILKFYGYGKGSPAWGKFCDDLLGLDVVSITAHRQAQAVQRLKHWRLEEKPDYTGRYNEEYEAMFGGGLAICQGTYERTGRMMLR